MVLNISAVVLLGVLVVVLIKKMGMPITHAVICTLFGFYLAATSAAPSIRGASQSVAGFIAGLTP